DGTYVLRAELPGVDPEKDIEVTVSHGILTISAHRQEETEGKHRSEFRYGAFARSVTLPERADEDRIRASYDRGVLEVVVNLKDEAAAQPEKRIPVQTKIPIKPTGPAPSCVRGSRRPRPAGTTRCSAWAGIRPTALTPAGMTRRRRAKASSARPPLVNHGDPARRGMQDWPAPRAEQHPAQPPPPAGTH